MIKDKKALFAVLKDVASILFAITLGAVALLFAILGLGYRSLKFIADYYEILVWTLAALTFVVLVLYVVFFLLRKQSIYRLIILGLICADIFAVIFYVICATGFIQKITSVEALQQYIDGFGAWAVIIYILFSYLQVVILPVPGSATVAAGVVLFGWLECSLYSFIGIVLGSVTAFAIGRWVGYKAVCWIVGKDDLDKWLDKIKGKDYLILSLMFLLPMFPDDVLCFVAGLSSMTWPYFLVMIVITRLISTFTVSLSFDLIPFNTWWGILTWIVLAALVVLAFYLVCKYSDKIDKFIKSKFKIKGRKRNKSENSDKK
ncbi:MAG TPA: TVP38/TMEM64 family protein [Candidatus Coproplasma excrementipullorum]|nr:TVP38/TMEM64 family protein [Candidatus Coproplasma excrementipullorum]